jgi:hypothetical protein
VAGSRFIQINLWPVTGYLHYRVAEPLDFAAGAMRWSKTFGDLSVAASALGFWSAVVPYRPTFEHLYHCLYQPAVLTLVQLDDGVGIP